ncbi:MAG: hypothetical protein UY81_C0035G0004 [Candidatus Giovannonibacteria bacterium GW2011_GWA2_53_7]|uniref:DUF4349 domain-containing protein n=1 Tax=Candidatus Giovannonibacteria bacterium GW2011_GWA2_53_7 TaxID=1618650 RepID=A0A0G1XYJ4_9BACT|nr:MAG: hypothetical protein UY81_C0035G0004 [Candidatus Giovannonibacteria bacterium GW2011_GWA2_53_7]
MQLTRPQKYLLLFGALVLVLLISSSPKPVTTSSQSPAPTIAYDEVGSGSFAMGNDGSSRNLAVKSEASATPEEGSTEQRIIRQADLSMLVSSVEEAQVSLQEIAKTHAGFVRDASVYEQQDKTLSGYAVLRVEASRFDSAMQAIRDLALNVERESVSGTDVTEQFVDLEAQLKNARAEEQAYLALLNRAGSVTELLEVQRELSNVRGRIEMFEGRLKYLSDQTDLATITINLSEKPSLIAPTGNFRLGDTFKEAIQTLVLAFQEVAKGLVWLLIFGVGIVLPVSLILWGVYRLYKRYVR